jgi:hypothetical protein
LPPLKSAELYAVARQVLDPRLSEWGFVRTPKASRASWTRPEGSKWLTLWFQPWDRNSGADAGFRFTVELLLGSEPMVHGYGYGLRFQDLLTVAARSRLLQLENRAISKLPPPNMDLANSLHPNTREYFLSGWKLRTSPYEPDEDVWFRQGDEDDVRASLDFIITELPAVLKRFLGWAEKYFDNPRDIARR